VWAHPNKPLIDVSNNIEFGATPKLAFADRSMAEAIQGWVPGALVVKTLNLIPSGFMINPQKNSLPPIQWMAGNDGRAKEVVRGLLGDLGWTEIHDLGGLEQTRVQEAIGLLLTAVVVSLTR